jgi:REP element-mobilizing transposase RayT
VRLKLENEMRQTSFGFLKDYKKEFGGSLLEGKRKTKRPLSTKHPIHLILKSSHKSLFNPGNQSLNNLIRSQAKKFNIKIYDLAVNWSHIHLLIKLQDREDYLKFIRSLTSILVQKIREKKPDLEQIFTLRPYTRILSWGKDFKTVLQYQILNQMESFGLIKREKKHNKQPKKNLAKPTPPKRRN